MSKRSQEEALIATKTAIWNLGFDESNEETSLAARPENAPLAMALVMDYLTMWPYCKIMKDWQSIFLSNVQPRMRTSTHLSVLSPSPIFAAFARSQASIILSEDDDVAILHEDIANVCGHNAEEYNGGVRNDDQEIVNSVLISYRKRRLQQVVTKQARVKVAKWMVEDVLSTG
jgi:hypothetical protein